LELVALEKKALKYLTHLLPPFQKKKQIFLIKIQNILKIYIKMTIFIIVGNYTKKIKHMVDLLV
jgi:hypothetical protein